MKIQYKLLTAIAVSIILATCNHTSIKHIVIGSDAVVNTIGRNDQWGFVGPGGGGGMFHPTISPADVDHAFISCDMTGSYVTYDGGKRWRNFNLRAETLFFTFDPSEASTVYAGTAKLLFKSIDKGNSWNTIYPRPSDILAIYSQGDNANEVVVTKDSTLTRVVKFAVDPEDSKKLFLLIQRSKAEDSKINNVGFLLVSEDSGKNWREEKQLCLDAIPSRGFYLNPASNIFIDPDSPLGNRTVYVTNKKGMQIRKNGEWQVVNLPEDAGSITQFSEGFDTKNNQHIIYALTGASRFNLSGNKNDTRIYKTNNGGQDWERLKYNLNTYKVKGANDPEIQGMGVSYYHPENIYLSYSKLRFSKDSTSLGVVKSTDSGNNWHIVWEDKFDATVYRNPGVSTPNRTPGWLTERFGPEWGGCPLQIGVAPQNPDICYATDVGRTIKTSDGGKTWQQTYSGKSENGGWTSRGLQVTTGYMLAFDPFNSLHVFMADTDTGLMESFDGGNSWYSATKNNGVPRRWVNTTYWLLFDPEVKDKVWAVMSRNHDLPRPKMWRNINMSEYQGGILVSTNGGKTWKPTSNEIGEIAPTHIIIDSESDSENRTLYVCAFGKGVFKSENGGKTWQQKNSGIEGVQPTAWRITRRKDGNLFLIVSRKSDDGSIGNDQDGALYRSSDGAETWIKMNLPDGVNGPTSLMIDPISPDRILLSAWGRYGATEFSPNLGGGIYLSENDGLTWEAVLTKDQHIHDLTIDNRNNVFYACGFNSSAYRSEDKGKTWERIKGYNFKWGKRVQPDPYNPEKVYIITFGGGVWHGPAKGDESALEDIVTLCTAY